MDGQLQYDHLVKCKLQELQLISLLLSDSLTESCGRVSLLNHYAQYHVSMPHSKSPPRRGNIQGVKLFLQSGLLC